MRIKAHDPSVISRFPFFFLSHDLERVIQFVRATATGVLVSARDVHAFARIFSPCAGRVVHLVIGLAHLPFSPQLRLLYECAPMAYIIEQAGGLASDGKQPILDVVPNQLHQRSPIFIGSSEFVKDFLKFTGQ